MINSCSRSTAKKTPSQNEASRELGRRQQSTGNTEGGGGFQSFSESWRSTRSQSITCSRHCSELCVAGSRKCSKFRISQAILCKNKCTAPVPLVGQGL